MRMSGSHLNPRRRRQCGNRFIQNPVTWLATVRRYTDEQINSAA